ncbi:MAG: hypothetical protein H7138_17030 [Myxococcales bacterium]|nr:hypothetical protein [Myxococcales bacterium]
MGDGDQRLSKRVVRFDSRDLARISKRLAPSEAEWDANIASAAGAPKDADAARISRTATLDDPLTTSLLAEVARRSMTVDVSPDQIDEATDLEPGEPREHDATAGTTSDPARDPARNPTRDPA